jgi:diguanylate cyclase (GGDEF)-like protein
MLKARLYDFSLFFIALTIAFSSGHILIGTSIFIKALFVYWLFSILYYHLRIINTNGSTSFDYGISYDLSLAIFVGPLGLLVFETVYRFSVYLYKKLTKTADEGEFLDVFYNIGSFVTSTSISYYLYQLLEPKFHYIPIGFWILMVLLSCITSILSSSLLVIVFYILRDIKTLKEGKDFIFRSTSVLDYGKTGLTNGLLLVFLQEQRWEMLFSLFLLNYVVSRSFFDKSQSIQNKNERDKFEQMAYTDFLTGIYNRTFMDKKMAELNQTGESIGIVVADIDKFKTINDSFNHAVGDKVIQHFAATLKSYLNGDDYLFRSGGEEFTLCLRGRNFKQTVELVERLLKGVENDSVDAEFNGEWISINYTASFGLFYYQVNEQFPLEKGYIMADQLLLQSKQHGRNRVSVVNGLVTKEVI